MTAHRLPKRTWCQNLLRWICICSIMYGFASVFDGSYSDGLKLLPAVVPVMSQAPLPTCTNAYSNLLPGKQACAGAFADYNPITGDMYYLCTQSFFTDIAVMRLTPNRTIVPYLDHPDCQFPIGLAGDWENNVVYFGCDYSPLSFYQAHNDNVTLLPTPPFRGSLSYLHYSPVTQTLYVAMSSAIFTYRDGIFSQLPNQNVTVQGKSVPFYSCFAVTRNEKLGKLFLLCVVYPAIQGIVVLMYDESLNSTSLVYPQSSTSSSSQCRLSSGFSQGFVFDNSGEYLFLPCTSNIFRIHIASGSLVPYYQGDSGVSVLAMAMDPVTGVLFASLSSKVLAFSTYGNPMQIASAVVVPSESCNPSSLLRITDDSLLVTCSEKVGLQALAKTYTFLAYGTNFFQQIVPVGDGSGDIYAGSLDGMWRLHNAQMISVFPNNTLCGKLGQFEILSFQPLRAFVSCYSGVILLLNDGVISTINVTTNLCHTPVAVTYQANTDDLFYFCPVIDSSLWTGGVFRIPNAFQQFPVHSFKEQPLANGTVCNNPMQLKTYGYDNATQGYYLLATCAINGLLRFQFHSDGTFDTLSVPPPSGIWNPQFHSMAIDESKQVVWVTGQQFPYCLWKFSIPNLSAGPVSVLNGSQCFSVDIDKENDRILVASFQDGILSVDPISGAAEVLLSSGICLNTQNAVTWSSRDSVTYAACGSSARSIVAISSHFRCSCGYEFKGGMCLACALGYYRPAPDVHVTVNKTLVWSCQPAPAGAFVPIIGSSDFQWCPPGTYSDGTGRSTCTPCAMGTFSNITGRPTSCSPCPPGSSAGEIGRNSCDLCPTQFFSSIPGSPSCSYCAEQVTADRTACLGHVCGRNQEYVYAEGVCVTCPLGSQSLQGLACQQCSPSWYTPARGQDCISCDYDTEGLSCSAGIASVLADHWAFLVPVNQSMVDCASDSAICVFRTSRCVQGTCPGGALQLLPSSDPDSNSTGQLHFCDYPRVDSFSNTLCGAAVDGYIPWGTKVVRCDPAVTPNGGVVFGLILLSIVLVVFLLRGGSSSAGTVSVLLYFAQITALEVGTWSKSLTWLQFANFRPTSTTEQCLANWTPYEQLAAELAMPLFLLAVLFGIGCVHYPISRFLLHSSTNRSSVSSPSSRPAFISCLHHVNYVLSSFDVYRYVGGGVSILLFCYVQISDSCFQWLNCISVGEKSVLFSSPTVDCHSSEYRSYRAGVIAVIALFVIGFPLSIFLFLFRHRHRIQFQERKAEQNEKSFIENGKSNGGESALPSNVSLNQSSATMRERILDEFPSDSSSSVEQSSAAASETSSSSSLADSFTASCGPLYLPYRQSSWFYQPLTLFRRAILVLIAVFVVNEPAKQFMLFGFIHLLSLLLHINVQPFVSARTNAAESLSTFSLIFLSFTLNGASRPYPLFVEVLSFLFIVPPLVLLFAFTLYHRWQELKPNVLQLFEDGAKKPQISQQPQQPSNTPSLASPSSPSSSHATTSIAVPNSNLQPHQQHQSDLDHELEVNGSIPMTDLRTDIDLSVMDHEVANL